MAKLHEILAVETDLKNIHEKIIEETKNTFEKKGTHFMKIYKKLEMFESDDTSYPEEHLEMVDTVKNKLNYTVKSIINFFDAVYQKEKTNQIAQANIVIEGKIIAEKVPATYLLGLEKKIVKVREMYAKIPTLQPGLKWEKDKNEGEDIYTSSHNDEKIKTKKTFVHKVLYQATKEHPAQIKEWEEAVNVGKYITQSWSSMLSPAEKSNLLHKIDELLQAVKKARQRANEEKVITETIGRKLFDYINS